MVCSRGRFQNRTSAPNFYWEVGVIQIRNRAVIVGTFFIVAAVASIIGLALYNPLLSGSEFILQPLANRTQIYWGSFFELNLVVSVIGTSISLYPVLRKVDETMAIGTVTFRLLEAMIIVLGITALLTAVTLNLDFGKAAPGEAPTYLALQKLLVALHNWTFLLGPNFALGPSTFMTGFLLLKGNLVPKAIGVLGLIGGTMIFVSSFLVMFGLYGQQSALGAVAAIPVFLYEMSLAVWLIAKGFSPVGVLSMAKADQVLRSIGA